jgi:hypothetical protein
LINIGVMFLYLDQKYSELCLMLRKEMECGGIIQIQFGKYNSCNLIYFNFNFKFNQSLILTFINLII